VSQGALNHVCVRVCVRGGGGGGGGERKKGREEKTRKIATLQGTKKSDF